MNNIIVKHYFLTETERIKMEEALINGDLKNLEAILSLDDNEITDLYNKLLKEKPSG